MLDRVSFLDWVQNVKMSTQHITTAETRIGIADYIIRAIKFERTLFMKSNIMIIICMLMLSGLDMKKCMVCKQLTSLMHSLPKVEKIRKCRWNFLND